MSQPYPPPPGQYPYGPLTPPPRKSWLRQHKVLTSIGAAGALIVALGVIGAVVGGRPAKTTAQRQESAAPAATTTASTPPPSLSPSQQRFVSDMRSQFNLTGSDTATELAAIGEGVCSQRGSGDSQAFVVRALGSSLSAGAAQVAVLAEKDLCPHYVPPPPKPRVIARFNGSGIQNTPAFSTGNNWHLSWAYWGCSGGQGNFIVQEQNTDGSPDMNGVAVNELGSGRGPVATYAYGDAGHHYFSVDSECSWSLAVVTGGG